MKHEDHDDQAALFRRAAATVCAASNRPSFMIMMLWGLNGIVKATNLSASIVIKHGCDVDQDLRAYSIHGTSRSFLIPMLSGPPLTMPPSLPNQMTVPRHAAAYSLRFRN